MPHPLSLEIIDRILQEVVRPLEDLGYVRESIASRDARTTLKSCSLVSRQWSRVAQTYLFRRGLSLLLPLALCEGKQEVLHDFLELMQRSPHIGTKMLDLDIAQEVEVPSLDVPFGPDLDFCMLFETIASLPKLHFLSLCGISPIIPGKPIQPLPATLEILLLDAECDVSIREAFEVLLAPLVKIKHINISHLTFLSTNRFNMDCTTAFSNLRILSLSECRGLTEVINDLTTLAVYGLPALHDVTFGWLSPGDFHELNGFFMVMKERLWKISLQFDYASHHPSLWPPFLCIEQCPRLMEVRFTIDLSGVCPRAQPIAWAHIRNIIRDHDIYAREVPMLRTIVFEYTEAVVIEDYNTRNIHLPRREMTVLEEALLNMPAPLCRIVFAPPQWEDGDFGEVDRSHVRRALRRLHARGMLCFEGETEKRRPHWRRLSPWTVS